MFHLPSVGFSCKTAINLFIYLFISPTVGTLTGYLYITKLILNSNKHPMEMHQMALPHIYGYLASICDICKPHFCLPDFVVQQS